MKNRLQLFGLLLPLFKSLAVYLLITRRLLLVAGIFTRVFSELSTAKPLRICPQEFKQAGIERNMV